MKRRTLVFVLVLILALAVTAPVSAGRGNGPVGQIYVTSQGLWYDTFATADSLPFAGKFQKLEGNTTEFGPGDPGYLGGRWWVDTDGNNMMDPTDTYFLCPLLGPGRETP